MALDFPVNRGQCNPVIGAPGNTDALQNGDTTLESNTLYTFVVDGGSSWWSGAQGVNLDNRYVEVSGDTMTGNLTVPSLNGGPLAGFRNQIINGSFIIRQRMAAGTPTNYNDNDFIEDRWAITGGTSVNGVEATIQNTNVGPNGNTSILRLRQGSATGSAVDLAQSIELPLEGDQTPYVIGSQWTLSFWYKGNTDYTSETVRLVFRKGFGVTNDQVNATSTNPTCRVVETDGDWTRYAATLEVSGDINSSANTGDIKCLDVAIKQADVTSSSFFCQIQLEPGAVVTPFEHRPIGTELALCQRYFYTISDNKLAAPFVNKTGQDTKGFAYVEFPVTMRDIPVVDGITIKNGSFENTKTSIEYCRVVVTGTANVGNTANVQAGATFDAEL